MENKGYYEKFNVFRKGGRDLPGGDRFGAQYFTLDLTHDPAALVALSAYAECVKDTLPELYADLKAKFPI